MEEQPMTEAQLGQLCAALAGLTNDGLKMMLDLIQDEIAVRQAQWDFNQRRN